MPYLTTDHVQQLKQLSSACPTGGGGGPGRGGPGGNQTIEDARMKCQFNIVKHQAEELMRSMPSRSTAEDDFYEYSIDVNTSIFAGTYSSIYLAGHSSSPGFALIGRVYEPSARLYPTKSAYLKVLKHVGKRSPNCIGTWDIYFDDAGRVVIFQEFALLGNLKEYLKQNNVYVPEEQMHDWAVQIYRAMDFLGDAGICHRSINPKHILITPLPNDSSKTAAKLGSFRDSIIYFDSLAGRVKMQPCLDKRHATGNNFIAPESFDLEGTGGCKEDHRSDSVESCQSETDNRAESRVEWCKTDKEKDKDQENDKDQEKAKKDKEKNKDKEGASDREFDPVSADVWSYGATFFFANTRYFPVKYGNADASPAPAIQKSINYAKNLSADAKSWFTGLLKPDPAQRTSFNQIADDNWFKKGPSGKSQEQW